MTKSALWLVSNQARYTKRELNSANEAKRLGRRILGYPSNKNYTRLISPGAISELPITPVVVRGIKNNGKDLASETGKIIRTAETEESIFIVRRFHRSVSDGRTVVSSEGAIGNGFAALSFD